MTAPAPDGAAILAAVRATWPPSDLVRSGPFDLPAETEGSRRATSARLRPGEGATVEDVARVEAARPGTVFGTRDGAEDALADLLRARGYVEGGVSDLMAGPVAPLLGPLPPVTGFVHWPPLAACAALWDAHGNPAARRRPMLRSPGPKAVILLRHADRAAGALFVACHAGLAVLHMVLTLPSARRQGVGLVGLRHAAAWAAEQGAAHLALPVEADNAPAVALYRRAGLARRGGYRYWSAR